METFFLRYWPFVRGIHWSSVNSPHKGQWRGALIFSLICAWTNVWANHRDAGDLIRHRNHYDVTVMLNQNRCRFPIYASSIKHYFDRFSRILVKYHGVEILNRCISRPFYHSFLKGQPPHLAVKQSFAPTVFIQEMSQWKVYVMLYWQWVYQSYDCPSVRQMA